MRIIITCGPSIEPIDEVRCITNFSTGELGALLCKKFHQQGDEVIALRSKTGIYPLEAGDATTIIPFSTNDDLERELQQLSYQKKCDALLHVAALSDYRISGISSDHEEELTFGKIATMAGALTMRLEPTRKIIAELRSWFPATLLIGWKYERDGTQQDAISKARDQITKYELDASVANGKAFGEGFEFIPASGELVHLDSKEKFVGFLVTWVREKILERSF